MCLKVDSLLGLELKLNMNSAGQLFLAVLVLENFFRSNRRCTEAVSFVFDVSICIGPEI